MEDEIPLDIGECKYGNIIYSDIRKRIKNRVPNFKRILNLTKL